MTGVLLAGGQWVSTALFYDPGANAWSSLPSMSTTRARFGAVPVTVSGVAGVLVTGGASLSGSLSSVEFYNPSTGSWTAKASMSTERGYCAGAPVSIAGVAGALVMGGQNNVPIDLSSAEFYNPSTDSWTPVSSMSTVRNDHGAVSITMGGVVGVLVVGGTNSISGNLATAEFYNPSTNAWTPVATMSNQRDGVGAAPVTRAGIAGVLAAGGYDNGFNYLSTAEFYNPSTNSWSPVASMAQWRSGLGAAPVTVGGIAGVLAPGGAYTGGNVSTVEFFCP